MNTPVRSRRFPWWLYALILVAIILLALSPLISVLIAGWIAESNGCILHEGNSNPCVVNGEDVGGTLYTMFVLGWFMLATIPAGAVAVGVLLLVLIAHLLWRRHRRRRSA